MADLRDLLRALRNVKAIDLSQTLEEHMPHWPFVLEKQVLIIENLTNLDQLPDFFLFVALSLKIAGGSGSPVRAVAFI